MTAEIASLEDIVDRFDGVLIDQFGVLHDGRAAFPGARDCLERLAARGVPVVAFSNDTTAAGNGAVILGLTPTTEIRRITSFAQSRGLRRIAAFLPDSAFGFLVADRLR